MKEHVGFRRIYKDFEQYILCTRTILLLCLHSIRF